MPSRFVSSRKFEKDLRIETRIHLQITHSYFTSMSVQNSLSTIHTEAFFGNLGAFATTVGVALQDKKVTLTEGMGIAIALVPFGDSIQNFKGMTVPEVKDLYRSEVENIAQSFAKRFDLANDEVEAFIEDCVRYVLATAALYNSGSRLFGKAA